MVTESETTRTTSLTIDTALRATEPVRPPALHAAIKHSENVAGTLDGCALSKELDHEAAAAVYPQGPH